MILKESPRLFLRPFKMEDAPVIFAMDSNPEVLRYLHTPLMKSMDEASKLVQRVMDEYEKLGTARLMVVEKESRETVGWAGLKFITWTINGYSQYHDVGYRFLKQHWGKGYATEAAKASIDFGFENLGLQKMYAMADANHIVSNKVLLKAGMKALGPFDYEGIPHEFYGIQKQNVKSASLKDNPSA